MNLGDVIGLASMFGTGGIIGSIIGLRYKNRKEKALADQQEAKALQEDATVDSLQLTNTGELIKLYKHALQDLKAIQKETEQSYLNKISEYEARLAEYEVKLEKLQSDLIDKNHSISELTKSQLKFKLELDQLKSESFGECDKCSFKSECNKYKAKQLKYECSDD